MTLLVGQAGGLTGSLKRRRASQVAGFAAVTIGAAAVIGWWAGVPLLLNWGPGLPAMRLAGAVCLAALGFSLIHPGKNARIAVVTGFAVSVFTALILGLVLLNIGAAVEWVAIRAAALGPEGSTFRVAHAATLAFGLAGGALALSRSARTQLIATGLASFAGAISVFALLGYLTGIDTLYGSSSLRSPPLPTAVGVLCVAIGIILRIGAMPRLRTPKPLWQLLTVLGCAVVAPLLLFGAYAEISIADAQLDEVRTELMNTARALSAEVDREIIAEIEGLQGLAASPSLSQGDLAGFRRQAEASMALRPNGNIILVDRNLQQLVDTRSPFGQPLPKTPFPEPVERALATGKLQIAGPRAGTAAEQEMFGIIIPAQIGGQDRYAVIRLTSQRALIGPVAAEELPPGWHAVISDAAHHIIARSEQKDSILGAELPAAQWHRAGHGGVFAFTDSEGRPSLEAYTESDLTGWETAVWEPKDLLEAPVRALWRTLGWLALIALLLVVGLALWLGRLIARSVGHAARAATALGAGNPLPSEGTPVAELNTLMVELRAASATRRAVEDLLRDSERQLRLVTDNVPLSIARFNTERRCAFANRTFIERYGLSSDQTIGKHIRELIGDNAFATLDRYIDECLAGKAVAFEFETTDRAGEPMFLQGRLAPEWRDGNVVGWVGATTDITGLKHAEQRLRASEVTFRQLVDNSPFGIYVVDADLRIMQASVGARKTFGLVQPLIGRELAEAVRLVWPEPFASNKVARFRHTLATGEPYHAPSTVVRRSDNGAIESYDWRIERVTMPDGRFGVMCNFYDLSERQKYEAALRESEATFRAMFDASSVGKIEVELDTGRFLRVNAAMCKFVGYSEAELLARTVFDITHPDERDRDHESLHRIDTGELPVFDREKRYIRKDGSIVWARVTANTIRNAAGRPIRNTAVVQDLTARKRAEEDLQKSKARLQLALDAAQLGWWQYDPLRRVGAGDARFQDMFDVGAEETPVEDMIKRVHPDDAERVRASFRAAVDPVNPKPSAIQYRVKRRDGAFRWVELHGVGSFEGGGRARSAVSLTGTVQDITERKEREEKEHLLIREINHRAKNMLSVVDAIAHQTATRSPEDFITRFSERIQALSANQDLLVRNEWNGVDISDLARAQLAHFADLIGSRIAVHGPKLRLKAASAQAIGLALHELATNAGKYGALSTDKGRVDIRWGTEGDTFTMSWVESRGPLVSPPKRRGFGTIVIEVMAERSVSGKVSLHYAPSGVTWRLSCPAANALESRERERFHGRKKIEPAL